jgi:hypothetical protein
MLIANRVGREFPTRKVALFCNVDDDAVITAKDVDVIYEVPLILHSEGLDEKVTSVLLAQQVPAASRGARRALPSNSAVELSGRRPWRRRARDRGGLADRVVLSNQVQPALGAPGPPDGYRRDPTRKSRVRRDGGSSIGLER